MKPSSVSTRRGRRTRYVVSFVAALTVLLSVADSAALGSGPAVIVKVHQASGVVSTYFSLHARPGGLVRAGTLELVNPTGAPVTVSLDPVDALTTATLGSAYQLRGGAIHGSTGWLRLGRSRVVIPALGHTEVPIVAKVPRSARPGDYLTGVAVEALNQTQPLRAAHGLAIGEVERYAIGVELSLPGPRHPLVRFTGARVDREPSGVIFHLLARNPGNVILKNVHGSAIVTRGRRTVASTQIARDTFVSGTDIAYPVPARAEQPPEGTIYRVRATLYYPAGVAHLDTLVTFGHAAAVTQQQYGGPKLKSHSFPWWWVALGCLAAALLAFVVVRRRRPLRRSRALALLRRELAAASVPLSVIHIELREASRAARRRVARTLKPRMRQADRLCDLGDDGLIVVLPKTDERVADGFASDLGSALERERIDARVDGIGASTAFDHVDPLELIERARAKQEDASPFVDG